MHVRLAVDVDRHLGSRGIGDVRRLLVVDLLEEARFVGSGEDRLNTLLGDRLHLHGGEQRTGIDRDLRTRPEDPAITGHEHVRGLLEGELTGDESTDLGVLHDDIVGTGRILVAVGDRRERVVGGR